MEHAKTWAATWGIILTVLVLCGWLDSPIAPTVCVTELKDGQGNTVQVSGKVAKVSVD